MSASIASDSTTVIVFLIILGGIPVIIILTLALTWISRRPPRCPQCAYRHLPIPARVQCPYVRNPPSLLRWFTSPLNMSSDVQTATVPSVVPVRRVRRARNEEGSGEGRRRNLLTTEEIEYWVQEMAPPLPIYREQAPRRHAVLIGLDGRTSPTPSYRSPAPSYKSPCASVVSFFDLDGGLAPPPNSPLGFKTTADPVVVAHAEAASGTPFTALPPAITRKSMRTLQRGRWPSTATI